MNKIVAVVDKKNTAIDRLAQGVKKYHDRFEYVVVDVHPKRASEEQLKEFEKHLDADLFDFMYWRTALSLLERYPQLKGKKKMISHYNPYSINESDWNQFDLVTGCNLTINKALPEITHQPVEYVPLTIDTDFWAFNNAWTPGNKVIMVANRIEGKKGIKEVAEACKKIGARFVLVGAVSEPDYFHEVISVGGVEFYQEVSDEELRKLYYGSTVHVCNSVDNFESGTLPILEAMLCGVPVLTRKVGHVPDLYNKENMRIIENKEDVDEIAAKLKEMIDDPERLRVLRDKAWQTAKSRSNERRAYLFQKLYRQVIYPNQESVSIVMPVCDKPEITQQSLEAIEKQTYKNIEVIMINDGKEEQPRPNVPFFKYIENFKDDYGLARARNKGIIEATGGVIVFCDQRIVMNPDAVEELVGKLKPRTWVYGVKNGVKKEWVENFSAVRRDDVIRAGMFCERIDKYGGQSQEARSRIRLQGMQTERVDSANAVQIGKSSNRNQKRDEIIEMKNRLFKMNLEM